jgi:superfamily II RNA helicase
MLAFDALFPQENDITLDLRTSSSFLSSNDYYLVETNSSGLSVKSALHALHERLRQTNPKRETYSVDRVLKTSISIDVNNTDPTSTSTATVTTATATATATAIESTNEKFDDLQLLHHVLNDGSHGKSSCAEVQESIRIALGNTIQDTGIGIGGIGQNIDQIVDTYTNISNTEMANQTRSVGSIPSSITSSSSSSLSKSSLSTDVSSAINFIQSIDIPDAKSNNEIKNLKKNEDESSNNNISFNETTEICVELNVLGVTNNDDTNDEEINLQLPIQNMKSLKVSQSQSHVQKGSWAIQSKVPLHLFEELRPRLAREYPFELDPFQKQAILQLESANSVFVAAHTSAGKTVVAEYAIALAKKAGGRAIYTSPIKALSNQKYRDFREEFGKDAVGLLTGDICVNPDAQCLIMTTEILRSMLYRGSDVVRDVQFVIFDEVHYVNNSERGVVWEETIIMLPPRIHLVFLSATTPNTMEFCEWVGRTKNKHIYVTGTSHRPVPLQHFLLYDDGYYNIMQGDAGFLPGGINAASKAAKAKTLPKVPTAQNTAFAAQRSQEKSSIAAQNRGGGGSGGRGTALPKRNIASTVVTTKKDMGGTRTQWLSLFRVLQDGGREEAGGLSKVDFGDAIKLPKYIATKRRKKAKKEMVPYDRLPLSLQQNMSKREYETAELRDEENDSDNDNNGISTDNGSLLPAVVFCFSKKGCEDICDHFNGQDTLTASEKSRVRNVLNIVKSRLSTNDARLPQVKLVQERALRGFGVHHGGLLPILKEATEVLFSEGLIRLLIATETFAMGVNMPARTVIFNGFRKHDGRNFRDLESGEYTQMAGRAGRRGKDKIGTVIVSAWGEVPGEHTMKKLLTGISAKLSSQFRLTYGMMLNLLRTADMSVEDMMRYSFSEFHTQRALSGLDITKRIQIINERLVTFEMPTKITDTNYVGRFQIDDIYNAENNCHCAKDALKQLLSHLSNNYQSQYIEALKPGRQVWYIGNGNGNDLQWKSLPLVGILLSHPKVWPTEQTSHQNLFSNTNSTNSNANDLYVWILLLLPPFIENIPKCNYTNTHSNPKGDPPLSNEGWKEKDGKIKDQIWLIRCVHMNDIGILMQKQWQLPANNKESILKVKPIIQFRATPNNIRNPSKNMANILPEVLKDDFLNNLVLQLQEETIILQMQLAIEGAPMPPNILNLAAELKLNSFDVVSLCSNTISIWELLLPIVSCIYWNSDTSLIFIIIREHMEMQRTLILLKELNSSSSLALFPDFRQRLNVLQRLGYADSITEAVLLKGSVACEMNTCNEVLASEIIFSNVLEPLNPPEIAGLLAALVCQEKDKQGNLIKLTSRMEIAKDIINNLFETLMIVQDQEGMVNDEDNKPSLNFSLSAVVYQWARGVPFSSLTEMTISQEGSIVRCISRLDELLKDIRNAARIIGNPSLYRQMEAASECICRDVVFAASLYID